MLIPKLMSCPGKLRAKDEGVCCGLSSSAAAAKGGKHSGDSGLKEESVQAICSRSQLDSQQDFCFPQHIMEL